MVLSGHFRDRIHRNGHTIATRSGRNTVVYRSLDLIAGLLSNEPGIDGLLYWAIGGGEPVWDDEQPASSPLTRQLTNEIYRKWIDPRQDIRLDPDSHSIIVQLQLNDDEAAGQTLREFGIFGGDASARPGSGYLINHAIHPAIERTDGELLERELLLSFSSDQAQSGFISLIPRLLANEPELSGIRHFSVGSGDPAWDANPPDEHLVETRQLSDEIYRKPIQTWRNVRYETSSRTLIVNARLDFNEAPGELREYGIFAGDSTDQPDSGYLISYQIDSATDHSVATNLNREFRIVLGSGDAVSVPDLSGRAVEEAEADLQAIELILGIVSESEHAELAPGTIVDQHPEGGVSAAPGTTVDIVVATLPVVIVPDLTGLTMEQAGTMLNDAGLLLNPDEPEREESSTNPNTVVKQTPRPGAKIVSGSQVTVILAAPKTVAVPDLTGLSPGEARIVLRRAGLVLAPEPHPMTGSDSPYDIVTSQTPLAEERVERGSIVTITISAPWAVSVPDLTGLTLPDAETMLRDAAAELLETLGDSTDQPGLAIGSQSRTGSDAIPGTIVAQNPTAGEEAPLFGVVDVTVARPALVEIPNLRGLTQPEALGVLENSGLVLRRTDTRRDIAGPGTVVAQEPKARVRVERGSGVTLFLADPILVRVPSLVGRTLRYADEVMTSRGLTLLEPTLRESTEPVDTVLEQEPPPGTSVPLGSSVAIVIATAQQVDEIRGALCAEPDTLYVFGSAMLASLHVTKALFDGPVDPRRFEDQPAIFSDRPRIEQDRTTVRQGQTIVVNGQVTRARLDTEANLERVVFRLAERLTWSDGQPVTAQDSVFAFRLAADADTPYSKFRTRRTAAYEAVDDRTVVWVGQPGWLDINPLRNFWVPLPQHILGSMPPAEIFRSDFGANPVGYGPFQFEEWEPGERIVLRRHPAYFRADSGIPRTDRITLQFGEGRTILEALRDGELDVALTGSIGPDQLPELRAAQDAGELVLHLSESTSQVYLMLCHSEQRTPFFLDRQVRQALAFALHREAMSEELTGGNLQVAHSFIPPAHPMHLRDIQRISFDPDLARRLLDIAGFGGGFEVTLLVPGDRSDRLRLAEMIVSFLRDVGIQVNLESLPPNELVAKGERGPLYSREFDMALMDVDFGLEPPARMFLSEEVSDSGNGFGGPNLSGFRSPDFDASALAALSTPDRQQQFDLWSRAQQLFAQELPAIPLFTDLRIAATRPEFSGFALDSSAPSEMWNVERFSS